MVPQDVQTDTAVRVDVGVVDTSGEVDLWGLEGVVGREVNVEEENASGVWRVALREVSTVPIADMRPMRLTGPMIVACQWNCYRASQSVYCSLLMTCALIAGQGRICSFVSAPPHRAISRAK